MQRGVLLPTAAYQFFPLLKKYENYGTKLNNHRNIQDYLDTNTSYMEYISHVIENCHLWLFKSKRLQQIIEKEIMDEITFILIEKLEYEISELYVLLSNKMIEKSKHYFDKLFQVNDPFEKAKLYEDVNYTEL